MSTTIYISPLAYLRSMVAIAWSAFRHPFTTTVVDLLSGKYVEQEEESHSEAISKTGGVQERNAIAKLTIAIRQLAEQEQAISQISLRQSELLERLSQEFGAHLGSPLTNPETGDQLPLYVKVGSALESETLSLSKNLTREGLLVVIGEGFMTATVTPWGAPPEQVVKKE